MSPDKQSSQIDFQTSAAEYNEAANWLTPFFVEKSNPSSFKAESVGSTALNSSVGSRPEALTAATPDVKTKLAEARYGTYNRLEIARPPEVVSARAISAALRSVRDLEKASTL